MKSKILFFFLIEFIGITQLAFAQEQPKVTITVGAGYGFQYFNSLAQSSETGTPIALGKYSTSRPLALRLQTNIKVAENQYLRILLSPFNETGLFTPSATTNIEGKYFVPGEVIKTRFGFNVLRIGYAKKVTEGKFANFKLGATLAVRKWQASFEAVSNKTANDNLIAVPLLFAGYEKFITPKLFFNTELDGVIVPFAYVAEGGSALNYKLSKHILVGLQYRILSGYYQDAELKNNFTTQNIGINTQFNF